MPAAVRAFAHSLGWSQLAATGWTQKYHQLLPRRPSPSPRRNGVVDVGRRGQGPTLAICASRFVAAGDERAPPAPPPNHCLWRGVFSCLQQGAPCACCGVRPAAARQEPYRTRAPRPNRTPHTPAIMPGCPPFPPQLVLAPPLEPHLCCCPPPSFSLCTICSQAPRIGVCAYLWLAAGQSAQETGQQCAQYPGFHAVLP